MKKFSEKITVAFLIISFVLCITKTTLISRAVYEAVCRCLETVIPSLYAVMTVSLIIIRSGVTSYIPRFAKKISELILGMEGYVLPIFTFSMFAGYPVGVRMLTAEYDNGRLSKKRAEILCGLCYGAGPSFIFGCISGKLYGSTDAGLLIITSTVSANILLALIMSFSLRKSIQMDNRKGKFGISADMLTECVIKGGRSIAEVCFMITAFAVISEVLEAFGAVDAIGRIAAELMHIPKETASGLICALLDITNVDRLSTGDYTILPYICGLISFGGLCVIFQVMAAVSGRFSMIPMVCERIAASVFSGVICRILLPFYMEHKLTAVSNIEVHAYGSYSPVPSIMLMIMTILLFNEYRQVDTIAPQT